ncbi:MAG: HAMP domain-containing protein [Blastochloris sp.]|nr:HAMP domain-containing protein [Blastochloris sp.]
MVGIAFGLCSGLMINRLVAEPVDALAKAARAVAAGRLNQEIRAYRADEFGLLINEFNDMVAGLRQKARLRETLGLHVGEKVAGRIMERDPGLSGVEEEITVMFVDIRGFTERTRDLDPAHTVQMLNLFLTHMVEVVETRFGGMVNKFLGDGFMAIFGIDQSQGSEGWVALQAALEMERRLQRVNAELEELGQAPLSIGMGLHSGRAVVGSIGSPQRLEFTAIGATVNLASRIEGLTKSLGEVILFTEEVRAQLPADFPCRVLAAQTVKGVAQPVPVFAPMRD